MKGGKKKSFGTETVQSPSETVAGDIAGDNGVGSEQLSGGDLQVEQKERDDGEEEERVAGDEDEDEEQEDEEKVVEEEEAAAADGEKPKLAEGFYEIETVRNRRIRKGKVQYLIKWRDWPETANTWEPVENLMTCYDFIEAYEESSRSGKQRSTRKRKRKQVVTPTPIKRKQQHQEECSPAAATYNVPAVKVRIIEERMPSSPPASLDAVNHVNSNGNDLISIEEDNVANGNDMELDSSVKEISEKNELDLKLSELKEVTATKETSADISGDGLTSGLSPANGTEILQSGRCTGAKRRKPASVRRFKQETTPGLVNDLHDPVTNTTSSPLVTFMKDGIQDHGFVSNVSGGKNKCDDSKDAYAITEIIKPMSYSASVSNGFQDVCVTFLAKRSDGNDVMVDNKFLKTNNPLLLINFYEKNLRYYATTTQ